MGSKIRRFECEVTTTNTYTIEIDENVINEEWMKKFSDSIYECNSLEGHVSNLARQRARNIYSNEGYIEGYGKVRVICDGWDSSAWMKTVDGICIKVQSEDEEVEVQTREAVT